MTSPIDNAIAEMTGEATLPRRNGELVFEAPWQSRAFAAAVALADDDHYEWETFRQTLIAEIASWENAHVEDAGEQWSYYERWLAALQTVLISSGLLSSEEINETTAREIERAPHEHDHE